MKYKKGDKVVIQVTNIDEKDMTMPYLVGRSGWVSDSDILGKLSDFTKPEKIRFSEAEKKELDKLDGALPFVCLDDIYRCEKTYPLLGKRLFCGTPEEDKAAQIEFVKAIEHPELIEVVKDKKYRLLFLGGYIGRNLLNKKSYDFYEHVEDASPELLNFTQSEIDKMQELPEFQAIDLEKCKEEVK